MLGINKLIRNFYIHIPFCIKKCYFCAFPIHAVGQGINEQSKELIYDQYCSKIQQQINLLSKNGSSFGSQHESIYFGGGTPSLLSSGQINSILSNFKNGISKKTEISLEMNPQEIYKAEQFIKVGINRLSIGIQSLNNQTLSKMNREYKTNNSLKGKSFKQQLKQLSKSIDINLDFIIDFNNSNEDRQQMLQFISFVRPKHLSLYILEINDGSYLYRNQNLFSNLIGKFQNYESLSQHLTEIQGYDHYQVSNFCMPGYASKHNRAYWVGDKQFGAFGMGATSLTNKMRITRPKNLSKYYQYVQNLQKGKNQLQILQTLEVNNEEQSNQKLKWILLSRLRRKQGITWSQLKNYLQTNKQIQIQHKINKLEIILKEINNEKPNLIDMEWLNNGIRLIIPQGFLYTDYIGYKIIDSLNL